MIKKIKEGGTVAVIVIFILALSYAVSWIATCGLIYLICKCFELHFTWKIATGIWIVLAILQSVFKTTVHKN